MRQRLSRIVAKHLANTPVVLYHGTTRYDWNLNFGTEKILDLYADRDTAIKQAEQAAQKAKHIKEDIDPRPYLVKVHLGDLADLRPQKISEGRWRIVGDVDHYKMYFNRVDYSPIDNFRDPAYADRISRPVDQRMTPHREEDTDVELVITAPDYTQNSPTFTSPDQVKNRKKKKPIKYYLWGDEGNFGNDGANYLREFNTY
jgi:hypothetical protein